MTIATDKELLVSCRYVILRIQKLFGTCTVQAQLKWLAEASLLIELIDKRLKENDTHK